MTMRTLPLISATLLALPCAGAEETVSPEAFAEACAKLAARGERSVGGANAEWLFLAQELKHLATGAFWERDAAEVTASGEFPTRFFTDLNDKLDAIGVQLVVVPVPAKAAIYPDQLVEGASATSVVASAPFLKTLSEAGVAVIDIEPDLRAARDAAGAPLSYCKTDSHPSPHACELIAAKVAEHLEGEPWVAAAAGAAGVSFRRGDGEEVEIRGDLIPDEQRASWPAETLPVRRVSADGEVDASGSPVIVIGDSHAQIFRDGGEMLLTGAGVVDHLQAELGFPVFVATSRGSAVQAQRQIYKDATFWDGRKVLVWLASVRSFTLERRWQSLPRLPR